MHLVERLATGNSLLTEEWQQLEATVLQDTSKATAFGINPENVGQALQARSRLLQATYPTLEQFCHAEFHTPPSNLFLDLVWNLWLPLALQLAQQRSILDRPMIQGILGGQGTGKTTLCKALKLILKQLGYQTLNLSLDDLYKTHADRQRLRQQDPRLRWRGPPGTHDVDLGLQVLDQLRQSTQSVVMVPRFDKSLHHGSGDRTASEQVSDIDIVLFEGWFVGVRPVDPSLFDSAPDPITTEADRAFARDMNAELHNYLPLWQRLDRLMVLTPVDYRLSKQWRRQAEQAMKAEGRSGMENAEIDAFVDYFWKALHPELFVKPLTKPVVDPHAREPSWANLVLEIQADRSLGKVHAR